MYKRNACSPSKLPVIGLWYCSDRENGHISQIKQVEYQLVKRNQWYSDRGNGKNFGSSSLLQGLEIAGHPLTLMVNVSKFRCRNTACQRKVFSAPLSPLASSHARNTRKVEERIRSISLKTTSRIASNLLHEQNIVCSQSSCLRRANVRHKGGPAPACIGLDDYAQKKGHIYGTVIVDQITHKPITLLSGRGEENLKKYLKGLNVHPFVICKLMRGHTGRDYMSPQQKASSSM